MKNREIKFRGLNQSNEMVYGDLIHGVGSKSGNVYILPRVINLAKIKHCDPLDGVKVNPESVGQFTGLHDKNGKEIYSKDLVRQGSDLYRIELCVGGFECIEIRELKKGGFIEGSTYSFSVLSDRYCEVIGNVFENPEILSDKN